MPLSAAIYSALLYLGLKKWSGLSKATMVKASIAFFVLQPLYGKLFVRLYDAVSLSWGKMRLLFWSVFKRQQYEEFVREKGEVQREILRVVETIGPEAVRDFKTGRIIKEYEQNRI